MHRLPEYTVKAAARFVAAQLRVDVTSLKKTKRRKTKPGLLAERLRILSPIMQDCLPGDFESAKKHVYKSAQMFRASPILEVVSLQFKYGPFKDALLHSWRAAGSPRFSSADPLAEATTVRGILVETALRSSGTDLSQWILNCGRGVSHHSGPAPVLMSLGVLQSCGGAVMIGCSSYSVVSRGPGVQKSLDKIRGLVQASRRVQLCLPKAVTTYKPMVDAGKAAQKALQKSPAPGLNARRGSCGYVTKWTLRCMLLTRLRRRLPLGTTSVADYMKISPDPGQWSTRSRRGLRARLPMNLPGAHGIERERETTRAVTERFV